MKPNNLIYKEIAEKITGDTYSKYYSSMYYMRKIAEHYNSEYTGRKPSNKYLKDWYTGLTGTTVSTHQYNNYYLYHIALYYDDSVDANKNEHYYLGVISDNLTPSESITLTIDKTILSYANSDEANLTATHSCGSGKTVKVYNGSTLIGTMTDNNDGTYSYTYSSQGSGDISITATDDTISSDPVSIEDCDYSADSTKINNWGNQTQGSDTFKVSSYSIGLSDFSLEIKFSNPNAQMMIGNKSEWVTGLSFYETNTKIFYSHNSSGVVVTDTISSPVASDIWRIEVEGTTIRLYRNNTLLLTKTNCKVSYAKNLRLYRYNLASSMEYVKVKPL